MSGKWAWTLFTEPKSTETHSEPNGQSRLDFYSAILEVQTEGTYTRIDDVVEEDFPIVSSIPTTNEKVSRFEKRILIPQSLGTSTTLYKNLFDGADSIHDLYVSKFLSRGNFLKYQMVPLSGRFLHYSFVIPFTILSTFYVVEDLLRLWIQLISGIPSEVS